MIYDTLNYFLSYINTFKNYYLYKKMTTLKEISQWIYYLWPNFNRYLIMLPFPYLSAFKEVYALVLVLFAVK